VTPEAIIPVDVVDGALASSAAAPSLAEAVATKVPSKMSVDTAAAGQRGLSTGSDTAYKGNHNEPFYENIQDAFEEDNAILNAILPEDDEVLNALASTLKLN
jgi:hypothetical protein